MSGGSGCLLQSPRTLSSLWPSTRRERTFDGIVLWFWKQLPLRKQSWIAKFFCVKNGNNRRILYIRISRKMVSFCHARTFPRVKAATFMNKCTCNCQLVVCRHCHSFQIILWLLQDSNLIPIRIIPHERNMRGCWLKFRLDGMLTLSWLLFRAAWVGWTSLRCTKRCNLMM